MTRKQNEPTGEIEEDKERERVETTNRAGSRGRIQSRLDAMCPRGLLHLPLSSTKFPGKQLVRAPKPAKFRRGGSDGGLPQNLICKQLCRTAFDRGSQVRRQLERIDKTDKLCVIFPY